MTVEARHIEAIQGARLLSALPDGHLQMLLNYLTPLRLFKGDVLFLRGEQGDSLAIVLEGQLAVHLHSPDSGHEPLGGLGPGAVVGEMACLDPARRSATVVATLPSLVMTLSRSALDELRMSLPAVAATLVGGAIAELTRRLRQTNTLIEQLHRELGMVPAQPPLTAKPAVAPHGTPAAGVPINLTSIPILEGMTQRDLELLTSVAPPMAFADGVELCQEGTVGTSCYLLLSGQVEVLRTLGGVKESLAVLKPRTLVGQLSLIDKAPRSATVRTRGEVVAVEMPRDVFERLLAAASPLGLRFQEELAIAGIRQLRMANGLLARLGRTRELRSAHDQGEGADRRPRQLIYVQAALSEWNLGLDELEEISDLTEILSGEQTSDLTELMEFGEMEDDLSDLPEAQVEISAIPSHTLDKLIK